MAEDLEGQNDEQLEGLSAKVKMLKDVSARLALGFAQSLLERVLMLPLCRSLLE